MESPDLNSLIEQRLAQSQEAEDEQAVEADDEVAASPEEVRHTVVRDYLRQELGVEIDDDLTDAELAPSIADFIRSNQEERTKWSQWEAERSEWEKERAELEELRKLREQLQAGKQDAEQPKQPKQEEQKPRSSALEYDPDWETAAELDPATGTWTPKEKYGSWGETAAKKLNEFQRARQERANLIISNPEEFAKLAGVDQRIEEMRRQVEELVEQKAKSYIEQFRNEQQAQRSQDQIESFFQQNKATFFELDAAGNPKIDPISKQPLRTEAGDAYARASAEVQELGVTDRAKIHSYALRKSQEYMNPKEQAKSEKPVKASGKQKRETFLDKASAHKPTGDREGHRIAAQRGGFLAEPEISFREMVLQDYPELLEKQ